MDGLDYIDEAIEASASTPAETSPTSTETAVDVVRLMNPVITQSKLPADRLPTSKVACTTCPKATWFSSGDEMQAHCGQMFLVVWTSGEEQGVEHCSAREAALLQLQR